MPPASWSATARWNRARAVIDVTITNRGPHDPLGPFEVYAVEAECRGILDHTGEVAISDEDAFRPVEVFAGEISRYRPRTLAHAALILEDLISDAGPVEGRFVERSSIETIGRLLPYVRTTRALRDGFEERLTL